MVAHMEMQMPTRLVGWKDIARPFGRSIAWCKRWATRNDGKRIPVTWEAGHPTLIAEDIPAWRKRVSALKPRRRT